MKADRFHLEGNNGGDYVTIEPLPDGRVCLEVGHCCVVDIDHIVPVEFITATLSAAVIEHGSVQAAIKAVGWPKDYTERLVNQVEGKG